MIFITESFVWMVCIELDGSVMFCFALLFFLHVSAVLGSSGRFDHYHVFHVADI